jgi:hypothetical protein
MPISGPAAGILGAAAGINAMLRGQIKGEVSRQQRERQLAEFDQQQQQLDIRAQESRTRADASGMTQEELIQQEIWVKWRTNPSSLTPDERIAIGLRRPASSSTTGRAPTLVELAHDAARGDITPEEFDETASNYMKFKNVPIVDQLFMQILGRTPKTRDRVHETDQGNFTTTTVVKENIPILEQYNTAIAGFKTVQLRLQSEGIYPTIEDIDAALGEEADNNPLGGDTQGPLTIEQELERLYNRKTELESAPDQ